MLSRLPAPLVRHLFNVWPCYRGTGGRITRISPDWREIDVEIPLRLRTRNYVGTIFGGSMYGAVDPIYMLMLIRNLGNAYVVWDKSAAIRFKKPGRSTLRAEFRLTEDEIQGIRTELEAKESTERTYTTELKSGDGTVHAVVEKLIYVAKKRKEIQPAGAMI